MNGDTGDLLRAAADGDQEAWAVLVERHGGLLWSIARSFRLSTADAGDAVQTTWLRLVENLNRIQDPDRLPGWLATTVRRECLALLRRTGRERIGPVSEWLVDPEDDAEPLDAGLLTDERDAALWMALRSISPRCQQLLRVLMATPPPSYAVVSEALEMPIGSIGPMRQRCLHHLRRAAAGDELLSGSPGSGER